MKFQATLYVLATLVAATLAIPILAVKTNLQSLNTQTRALDDAIKQLPDNGRPVLDLQIDIANLLVALDQATVGVNDIKGPMTESDGATMLSGLQSLKSTMSEVMNDLMAKDDVFTGLGMGDVMSQDMQNLKSSTSGYEGAVKAKVVSLRINF